MFLRYRKPMVMLLMCLFYGFISLFSAYSMIKRYDERRKHERSWNWSLRWNPAQDWINNHNPTNQTNNNENIHFKQLEIWDTSGVGIYLWEHILQGQISDTEQKGWYDSFLDMKDVQMWYRLGYGLRPEHGPPVLNEHLFLALNGRSAAAVEHSKSWLDYVLSNRALLNLGILLLGDEYCDNAWLDQYLHDDRLRLVFLVYDSPIIDNKRIFSWPLGVAAYRGFAVSKSDVHLTNSRKYTCNFYGTVYDNSSRKLLMNIVKESSIKNCKFKWRNRWTEDETVDTLSAYQQVLTNSDLTLSPVGKNAECYRTYEAIESGSIPIVEDLPTSAKCNITSRVTSNESSPYLVLKERKAPLIYVKDWKKLPHILKQFADMTTAEKGQMRLNLFKWYADFKKRMKMKFLTNTINLFHWDVAR